MKGEAEVEEMERNLGVHIDIIKDSDMLVLE